MLRIMQEKNQTVVKMIELTDTVTWIDVRYVEQNT